MKRLLIGLCLLMPLPAQAQDWRYLTDDYAYRNGRPRSESIPFWCRPGSFAYVHCDPNGNIIRHHTYDHYRSYPGRMYDEDDE